MSMIQRSIEATVWVHRGSMMINRDALAPDDPESWPSLWKAKFGEDLPYSLALDLYGRGMDEVMEKLNAEREFIAQELYGDCIPSPRRKNAWRGA